MSDAKTTEPEMHEGTLGEDGRHCDTHDCWCWDDRYMVITRDTSKELMEAVNAFIHQKGWQPLGGVSHHEREEYVMWAQAMVRHV